MHQQWIIICLHQFFISSYDLSTSYPAQLPFKIFKYKNPSFVSCDKLSHQINYITIYLTIKEPRPKPSRKSRVSVPPKLSPDHVDLGRGQDVRKESIKIRIQVCPKLWAPYKWPKIHRVSLDSFHPYKWRYFTLPMTGLWARFVGLFCSLTWICLPFFPKLWGPNSCYKRTRTPDGYCCSSFATAFSWHQMTCTQEMWCSTQFQICQEYL